MKNLKNKTKKELIEIVKELQSDIENLEMSLLDECEFDTSEFDEEIGYLKRQNEEQEEMIDDLNSTITNLEEEKMNTDGIREDLESIGSDMDNLQYKIDILKEKL